MLQQKSKGEIMMNQTEIYKKIFFADNKVEWENEKNKEDMFVIIKNDGKIDMCDTRLKDDKSCFYLSCGLAFSVTIIIAYLVTYSLSELFPGGEALFSLGYQLAISYVMGVLIYLITVIVPQKARREKTRVMINNRLAQIAFDMNEVYKEILNAEDSELKRIDFNAKTNAIDISTVNMAKVRYLSLAEYVLWETKKIREECKSLLDLK